MYYGFRSVQDAFFFQTSAPPVQIKETYEKEISFPPAEPDVFPDYG